MFENMNKYESEHINKYFELPIYFQNKKAEIRQEISDDLDLIDSSNCLYNCLMKSDNAYSKETMKMNNKYFSYDKKYLSETKTLLHSLTCRQKCDELQCWNSIKGNKYFIEKYHYIDWDMLKFLNNSSLANYWLCVYRLFNPFCSLLLPLIMLIATYFMLKFQGMPYSLTEYLSMAYTMFMENSALFNIFNNEYPIRTRIYYFCSFLFYIFGIYNNFMTAIRFHYNLKEIHDYFQEITKYIKNTIHNMEDFLEDTKSLTTYKDFCFKLKGEKEALENYYDAFDNVGKYQWTMTEFNNMGFIMQQFYLIYENNDFHKTMMYSFGFNGYISNLNGIIRNIKDKKVKFCTITNKKETSFKDAYLPNIEPVTKNSYNLNKELIITGPNASGKTTMLKTTLFNILISQQYGVGYYSKANINLYEDIHCYLNIPDTSGRDSLFQAEARRCKNILEDVSAKKRVFCIFDELFSGTNPYEAVAGAFAFLNYLTDKTNIHFMLTTHFIDLCKNMDKSNKKIENMHMDTIEHQDYLEYKYKLKSEISTIKGGVHVLIDLGFPNEIIDNAKKFLLDEY